MTIKWLQRGFLGLVALASLFSSIQNLISTKALGSLTDDPVADWEQRFRPIKERLPFQRGLVGYVSDSNIPGVSYDSANEEGEYVLTQYALAPIIIVKGTDQEWNIGNLSTRGYELWSAANPAGFEVIQFRGGLYLLHRITKCHC
jgi:hypothetical protein